jgi:ferredoxin-NADP reductase
MGYLTKASDVKPVEHELDLVLAEKRLLATDVVELTLRDAEGAELPEWHPGAHIDLVLGDDLVRQYSLCGEPDDHSCYRVAVLREPASRGGSVAVHEKLATGDRVKVRGPRNNFHLVSGDSYIFIGGGIGITPLIPMLNAVDTAGASWELHYGGRTEASMAYLEELRSRGEQVHIVPQDQLGILDLATILGEPKGGVHVYTCGPEPLLAAVEAACEPWPMGALHLERFTPKAVDPDAVDTAFEIELSSSGQVISVPADQSVFVALREAGVDVLGSCLEGTCGTCETGVLEGEVDHRDSILNAAEQEANDCMMVCVSRAKSHRLVLDI